jgi:hypothetical protein
MRDTIPFVDLTGGNGSSSGATASHIKEEPKKEDEEATLAQEYEWFRYHPP